MGTPDFAREQLSALYENRDALDSHITGVISQPDKPKNRGHAFVKTDVKLYAEEVGLPVFQPETLRDEAFAALLKTLDPELIVVAAYGKILPGSVLSYPKYGCVNVHGSLLPAYRGAAPIQRAVINGETVTGVTIMYMASGMDTGDMLAKVEVPILPEDDTGSMYEKLAAAGASLLVKTIPQVISGSITAVPQKDADATYAPKITKADTFISFDTDAASLHNLIRGLSPQPSAQTILKTEKGEHRVKIVKSAVHDTHGEHAVPGTVLALDDKHDGSITVACRNGALDILFLTPAGKGTVSAAAFIRGRQIVTCDRFEQIEL